MSICCKLVRIVAVIFLAVHATPQELNSTLYTTIFGAPIAFSNENVSFTCIARGTIGNHIGWSSEQYISAVGRRLEFLSAEDPGTTRTSGDSVAVLVRAVVNDIIESRLYVRIQPAIPIASVQCHNIDTGTMTSITFRLAANDTSVQCDKQSVCPGEAVTCVCATGTSNSIAWVTDGGRLQFTSNDRLLERRNVTGSSTYGILIDRYNESGIEVLTSNLTLTASMDDTSILAKCENVDRSTSNAVLIPISRNCPDPNETTSPPRTEPAPSTSSGPSSATIALAVVCVVLIILFILIVCLLAIIIILLWRKSLENKALKEEIIVKNNKIADLTDETTKLKGDIDSLNTQIGKKDEQIGELKTESGKKDGRINELQRDLGQKEQELQTEKQKALQKYAEMGKETSELRTDNQRLERGLERKEQELQAEKHKVLQKQRQLEVKEGELKALQERLETLSSTNAGGRPSSQSRGTTPTGHPPSNGRASGAKYTYGSQRS